MAISPLLWNWTPVSSLRQTTSRPQSSSPILSPRPWAEKGRPGSISPPAQSRPDLPVPPTLLSQGNELGPRILQVQGHKTLWGLCPPYPRPGQSQDRWAGGRRALCGQDLQSGRPGSWCSGGRRVESVPLYGQLSLIVIVCTLGAQQTSRGDTPSTQATRSPATRPIRTVN